MAKKGEYEILTGQRFGRWLVLGVSREPYRDADGKNYGTQWVCECDCGTIKNVSAGSLKSGDTRSCGCLNAELIKVRSITHGARRTPEYGIWGGIKSRTKNQNSKSYKDYGARGIAMCDEWLNDFEAFYNHVGPRPSPDHTLERKNNDEGYQPGNVVWALRVVQANNKRSNVVVTIDGVTQTLAQWCRQLGRSYKTVHARIKAGWDQIDAILTPAGGCWNRRPSQLRTAK